MSHSFSVLVVDDEQQLCRIITQKLKLEGFRTLQAHTGLSAIDLVKKEEIDVVILDYGLPDLTGIEVLEKMKEENRQLPIIMLTAYGKIEDAVRAMKLGAYDFINKPVQLNILKEIILKACENHRLNMENKILKDELQGMKQNYDLVFQSEKMNTLVGFLEKIMETDVNILILGESGVGKTALAKWIHHRSNRRDKPFVSINCAAIPPSLLESEFFGFRKGAFTGANESRPGKFEVADGGTIFLDEIGEVSLEIQAKLLHVIEEKKFMRLGSNTYRTVDVRIITATNKNIKQLVETGKFREDLYYRLNLAEIEVPPLRQRTEDIPSIVQHYLNKFNKKYKKDISISDEAIQVLVHYAWKGNIRELLNVLERIHILKTNGIISMADLPHDLHGSYPIEEREHPKVMDYLQGIPKESAPLQEILNEVEKKIIDETLIKTGGNQTKAADILGISRPTLIYKMKKMQEK